jgi:hypothetical protein
LGGGGNIRAAVGLPQRQKYFDVIPTGSTGSTVRQVDCRRSKRSARKLLGRTPLPLAYTLKGIGKTLGMPFPVRSSGGRQIDPRSSSASRAAGWMPDGRFVENNQMERHPVRLDSLS